MKNKRDTPPKKKPQILRGYIIGKVVDDLKANRETLLRVKDPITAAAIRAINDALLALLDG